MTGSMARGRPPSYNESIFPTIRELVNRFNKELKPITALIIRGELQ